MNVLSDLKTKKRPFLALNFHRLKLFKVLCFCFFFGAIYGIFVGCLNSDEINSQCTMIIQNFLRVRSEQSFFLTCLFSFLTYCIPIVLIFFLGFIPVLQFAFFLILVFYGLGFGVTVSHLIFQRHVEGLLIFSVEILPCALISVLVLILSCKESFRFSNKIFKKLFFKINELAFQMELKIYLLKFLTLLTFQLVAALLDGFCNFVFFKI